LADRAPSLLIVCLGNICRSPMAEGALRLAAREAGLVLTVDSAGTGNWHVGEAPDPRARAEMKRHGIDIGALRARQVGPLDFSRFDYLFAADRQNLADLQRLAPTGSRARLHLLLDWVPGREGSDVADPYFGDEDGFAATREDVFAAAAAIVRRLAQD
jgi:protein-tyrosine phosphatase